MGFRQSQGVLSAGLFDSLSFLVHVIYIYVYMQFYAYSPHKYLGKWTAACLVIEKLSSKGGRCRFQDDFVSGEPWFRLP